MDEPLLAAGEESIEDLIDFEIAFDWFGFTKEGLSSADVLMGLLDFGLFAEKVPPCFSSAGLTEIVFETMADLLDEKDEKSSRTKLTIVVTTMLDMKRYVTSISPGTWGFRTRNRMQSRRSRFQNIGRRLPRTAINPSLQSAASMFAMSGMDESLR